MKNRIADKLLPTGKPDGDEAADDDQANRIADAAIHQLDAARRSTERFVGEHPLICLGAAVATGIAVGWWVKRK